MVQETRSMPAMRLQEIVQSFIPCSFLWRDLLESHRDLLLVLPSRPIVMKVVFPAIIVGQSFMPKENGGPLISVKQINTQPWLPITLVDIRQIELSLQGGGI